MELVNLQILLYSFRYRKQGCNCSCARYGGV